MSIAERAHGYRGRGSPFPYPAVAPAYASGVDQVARRVTERVPAWARPGTQLVTRTVADTLADRVTGLAAEMAFFLILSLPPLLVTVLALVALLADAAGVDLLTGAQEQTVELARRFLTADTVGSLEPVLERIRRRAEQGAGVLLSFGFLLTLVSASRALRVTTVAITIAYDLEATRPGWKQFLYGILLTLVAPIIGLVIVPLFVGGPGLGQVIVDALGLPPALADLWGWLYWPAAAVVVTLLIASLYHVAAPWTTPWLRDLPGAALAMVIGLAGTYGLRLYTDRAVADVFGALAAPLVVLVWLFLMSLAVLLGAEFNAEIERMWPHRRPDQPPAREDARVARAERET